MKQGGEIEGQKVVKEDLSVEKTFEQRLKNPSDGPRQLPGGAEF